MMPQPDRLCFLCFVYRLSMRDTLLALFYRLSWRIKSLELVLCARQTVPNTEVDGDNLER